MSGYKNVSKPGTVGEDMPAAFKGELGGAICVNYKGRRRNADPDHPHNPANRIPVSDWAKRHLKGKREKARDAKKSGE